MNDIIHKIEQNLLIGINSVICVDGKNFDAAAKSLNERGFKVSKASTLFVAKTLAFTTTRNNKDIILYTGANQIKPVKKKFDVFKYSV